MKPPLQVIHLEDSALDSEVVCSILQSSELICDLHRVETREQFASALREVPCDLILSDCSLPQFDGLEALELARAMKPKVPFIFVSGTIGEEAAIDSLQNGATDYVLKHRLSRLAPAIRRAIAEAEGRHLRQSMEASLHQAQKLAGIGTSVGAVAHDIRNLLLALKLNSSLLPSRTNDPEAILKIAQRLDTTIDRGCQMMQELLVFARRTETRLVPLDLAAQVRETSHFLQASLPSNINLHFQQMNDLPTIMADSGQVDRILTNLIVNARDAMPEGGKIVISADVIRFDPIPVNSWKIQETPYLRLKISDNGAGIDETTQARIFEPFFTTKQEGKGTGLGLSVVLGLMEAHHGFVNLQSKLREGTTFSLFFPVAHADKAVTDPMEVVLPIRLLGNMADIEGSHAGINSKSPS